MSMIQSVEKLPDVYLHQPAATPSHRLVSDRLQGLMRRTSRPETVRAVKKVLLVYRLQGHDDRTLEDFVLQGRYPQRTSFIARPFGNSHPTHWWCPIGARLGALQKRLQVPFQVPQVVFSGLAIDTHGTVQTRPPDGFAQPIEVEMVVERGEPHRRRLLCQLRYSLLFRAHGIQFRCTGHVSLQRFHNPAPPSLHRLHAGRVRRLRGYYEALR